MSRWTENERRTQARIEGLGDTALAAMEDVESQLRQLGPPDTKPGKWSVSERYFRTLRATPAILLFECEVSLVWLTEVDEETEPF